ncbi:ABC transporter permease [Lysobacter enzymogenes]|uniref:FtsX-like permease family protein n=1 Tax=Lysobacter enzymogenes TaxID=69 RepID=A0A3N2RN30_LYSEN|nr:ABC transporter permease [Lysobacter enzymogenes]ROU08791.1 FtsX-like permease family protein [Lysobacter enzymogenes]
MTSLARQTLRYEWRRFLPAVLAIGFSSLLLLLQAALVLGIFGSASVCVSGSSADLWLGYPGTQSVDQGRPVDPNLQSLLLMQPQVAKVEPFYWLDADWRGPAKDTGGVSVYVSGIDIGRDGLMFSRALSPELRQRLALPDSVIVDRSELDKLGVGIGQSAHLNGHRVRVVGAAAGLRALGGVNVVASLDTARRLQGGHGSAAWPAYFVARLRDPAQAPQVIAQLRAASGFGRFEAWSAPDFARQAVLFWMFDTGAGAGVLFLAGVVLLVGAVITSQALVAAVNGSVREYATLNALGIGMRSLRWVVLEQALWVGAIGVVVATGAGLALIALARARDVPVLFDLQVTALCMLAVMALASLSGLSALRGLRRADPAVLLR